MTDQAEVLVDGAGVTLPGLLGVPERALGVVIFAHGSGSSRLSPRNQWVATRLRAAGLATLLFDLLTDPESTDRRNVFDIPLLAERLGAAADWAAGHELTSRLAIGFFGASTGAGAALTASVGRDVAAVVSRGGRPDLAAEALGQVSAPTLLIVGGADEVVLDLNQRALEAMTCRKALEIVPGAGHLFEEPGAMERVADLAEQWFVTHLAGPAPP